MLTLLITVVLGVAFAIFATQNTEVLSLDFGSYTLTSIPVYLVILIPLLIGVGLSFIFHFVKDLSLNLTIDEEKDEIKRLKKELAEVTKNEHQLQIENNNLKNKVGEEQDENSI